MGVNVNKVHFGQSLPPPILSVHRISSLPWIILIMLQVLHYFSDVKYKNEAVLAEAFRLTVASLLHDKEPPVKVRRKR